jgi:hypothetical protein
VEETSALLVLHGDLWVTTAIDDSDNISIGLCTVRHEAFEVGIFHAVLFHEIVELSPDDTLDLLVLRLHVTYRVVYVPARSLGPPTRSPHPVDLRNRPTRKNRVYSSIFEYI